MKTIFLLSTAFQKLPVQASEWSVFLFFLPRVRRLAALLEARGPGCTCSAWRASGKQAHWRVTGPWRQLSKPCYTNCSLWISGSASSPGRRLEMQGPGLGPEHRAWVCGTKRRVCPALLWPGSSDSGISERHSTSFLWTPCQGLTFPGEGDFPGVSPAPISLSIPGPVGRRSWGQVQLSLWLISGGLSDAPLPFHWTVWLGHWFLFHILTLDRASRSIKEATSQPSLPWRKSPAQPAALAGRVCARRQLAPCLAEEAYFALVRLCR